LARHGPVSCRLVTTARHENNSVAEWPGHTVKQSESSSPLESRTPPESGLPLSTSDSALASAPGSAATFPPLSHSSKIARALIGKRKRRLTSTRSHRTCFARLPHGRTICELHGQAHRLVVQPMSAATLRCDDACPGGAPRHAWRALGGDVRSLSEVQRAGFAASDDAAWPELEGLGWTAYRHSPGSRSYAVCPACSKEPPDQVPTRKARAHR
jgi:hypothetical protein